MATQNQRVRIVRLQESAWAAQRRLNEFRNQTYDASVKKGEPMLHVHVEWSSSDCDGRTSGDRIDTGIFREVVENAFRSTDLTTWEPNDDNRYGGGLQKGYLESRTEEGGAGYRIYECEDLCVREESRRDHSAEAMGY